MIMLLKTNKFKLKKFENKTISELQVLIFQTIKNLPSEKQELQQEIHEKRNKNKAKVCEILLQFV